MQLIGMVVFVGWKQTILMFTSCKIIDYFMRYHWICKSGKTGLRVFLLVFLAPFSLFWIFEFCIFCLIDSKINKLSHVLLFFIDSFCQNSQKYLNIWFYKNITKVFIFWYMLNFYKEFLFICCIHLKMILSFDFSKPMDHKSLL